MTNLRLAACATVLLAGCASYGAPPPPDAASPHAAAQPQALHEVAIRCQAFAADFHQLAACQRADGTLQTFGDPQIAWRVRYFVRYWTMPCNEAPTRDESYVFAMATRDLYDDPDLSDAQRRAVRDAMFQARPRCR